MQEAEAIARRGVQRSEMAPCAFEQLEGAGDVGGEEIARRFDRAIDVALGREVDDRARRVIAVHRRDGLGVGDVAAHEDDAIAVDDVAQVLEAAGVGEQVEHDEARVRIRERVAHEVAADEARAAGHDPGVALCRHRASASTRSGSAGAPVSRGPGALN